MKIFIHIRPDRKPTWPPPMWAAAATLLGVIASLLAIARHLA